MNNMYGNYLNIGAFCRQTKVLGPGNHFVIWVQGCMKRCVNCGSPSWLSMKTKDLILPSELAKLILDSEQIEGLTISGGEPMLQAQNLNKLLDIIYGKNLGVICYTGYTLEELTAWNDSDVNKFLSKIDLLIDGEYVEELNDNKGIRDLQING